MRIGILGAFLLALGATSACSSESTTSLEGPPSGTYIGDLVVQHDDPSKSVFTTTTLSVASGGGISGTATTKQPTSKIGEVGTVTGSVTGRDPTDVSLVLTFPTLGTFRAHGAAIYASSTRQMSFGSLTTDDGTAKVVGRTTGALQLQ